MSPKPWGALAVAGFVVAAWACTPERDEPPRRSTPTNTPRTIGEPIPKDEPIREDEPRPAPKPTAAPDPSPMPEDGSCRIEGDPILVWPRPASSDVAFARDRTIVAGWSEDGGRQTLFARRIGANGVIETFFERALSISPGTATPSLHVDGDRLSLAYVAGGGTLHLATFDLRAPSPRAEIHELATAVDRRFPIALAQIHDHRLVAFTAAEASMRVKVLRLDGRGKITGRFDVTPEGMGATAPVFVDGASPPRLVSADARAGVSPLLVTAFEADGTPRETRVERPLGGLLEPPRLAAARTGERMHLAYSALGMAATSAIGLVRLDDPTPPIALVRGEGYGPITVHAASFGNATLVAMEAPRGTTKDSPREVRIVRLGDDGPGPALSLPEPARHPRIATRLDGSAALVVRTERETTLIRLRCAP